MQADFVSLAEIEGIDGEHIEHWCNVWHVNDRLVWLKKLREERP